MAFVDVVCRGVIHGDRVGEKERTGAIHWNCASKQN
jgi:hypothetical protein